MAAELRALPDIALELIPGAGGIFDVVVDGDKIFSKRSVGRFPYPGEITAELEKRTA